jgi:transcriptional regulator with XRE-family HTH domain
MDGEKIQAMRQARGLSRQEFAQEAGIAVDSVDSVERGELVRATTGWRVAWALGVHPREIGRPASKDEQLAFFRTNYAPYPEM